jgi:hypothetical protein
MKPNFIYVAASATSSANALWHTSVDTTAAVWTTQYHNKYDTTHGKITTLEEGFKQYNVRYV